MSHYQWQGSDLLLRCHLQPKASSDAAVGLHGDRLKLRITAPPVDGKANAHLVQWLGKQFGVARSQVTILQGETGRAKNILIRQPARLPADFLIDPAAS